MPRDPMKRAYPNAQERAWVFKDQLQTIQGQKLRARFVQMILDADPEAAKILLEEMPPTAFSGCSIEV